jgi:hypothetical protein
MKFVRLNKDQALTAEGHSNGRNATISWIDFNSLIYIGRHLCHSSQGFLFLDLLGKVDESFGS